MQYRVSVPKLSDICTLVTRLLSHSFNHSICIAIINADIKVSPMKEREILK